MKLSPFFPFLFMMMLSASTAIASWEKLAPLPLPNAGFAAGWVKNHLLIAGGTHWHNDTKIWLDKTWRFHPSSNRWEEGPLLPHPVAYAAFGCDGEKLYLAGGTDGTIARADVYEVTLDLQAKSLPPLSQPVAFAGGCINAGKFWRVGGTADPDDWSRTTSSIISFNPIEGVLSSEASLPTPHGVGLPCVVSTPRGIFVFTEAWLDPKAQQIKNLDTAFVIEKDGAASRLLPPYPKAARGVAAVLLDEHHLYLAGGYGSDAEGFLAESWIFDTRTQQYTPATPLPIPALTCLINGGGIHLRLRR